MQKWQIDKPLGQCWGTGKKIEPGEEYIASLVETEQGLQRRDFCIDYWQKEKPQVFCYWKTKLPQEPRKSHFIDDEALMAFFERLEGESTPEKINFRFILALILMRKRLLKYHSSRKDGGNEIWSLKVVGSDQLVEVVNPGLQQAHIEQLSSQIRAILQMDL